MSYADQLKRENEQLLKDRNTLLKALRDLAMYCGGSDLPKSHPIGAAWKALSDSSNER